MKTTYTLSEWDIKEILKEYMKKEYNMMNPYIILKQEIQEGYSSYSEGTTYKKIIATVSEF